MKTDCEDSLDRLYNGNWMHKAESWKAKEKLGR